MSILIQNLHGIGDKQRRIGLLQIRCEGIGVSRGALFPAGGLVATSCGAGTSAAGAPHSVNTGSSPRQIRVGPRLRTVWRSVVTAGIVQVSVTPAPLRVARKSDGGCGRSSDGGFGGPIVAHAASMNGKPSPSSSFRGEDFMEKKQTIRSFEPCAASGSASGCGQRIS